MLVKPPGLGSVLGVFPSWLQELLVCVGERQPGIRPAFSAFKFTSL